jgi:hypothetical protein
VAKNVKLLTFWIEGDDTAYGQALFPVPAEDPNDPLQARLTSCLLSNPMNSLTNFMAVAQLQKNNDPGDLFPLLFPW